MGHSNLCGGCTYTRLFCIGIPLVIISGLFIAFVSFVLYSFQIFKPVAPTHTDIGCDYLHGIEQRKPLAAYVKNRSTTNSSFPLEAKCWDLRKRRYLPMDVPEFLLVRHYIMFFRHVTRNYEYTETAITMMFSPLHFYCITLDKNSTESFQSKIRHLGSCIYNIIVPDEEFDGNDPRDYFRAQQTCFNLLAQYPWEHAVITQEEEVAAQSTQAIGKKAEALGMTSVIGNTEIHLFPNATDQLDINRPKVHNAYTRWINDRALPIILSRAAQPLIYDYLMSNGTIEEIAAEAKPPDMSQNCKTNHKDRFGNCIMGMENINEATQWPTFFVRADPTFDYGFVQCVHEAVFRKTYRDVLPANELRH